MYRLSVGVRKGNVPQKSFGAPKIPNHVTTLLSTTQTRTFSRKYASTELWGERERSMENLDVKKHDEELLKRLRDAELAKEKAEARAKVAEQEVAKAKKDTKKSNDEEKEENPWEKYEKKAMAVDDKYVAMEEFLDFRKEIVNRMRDLEDEIHTLKYEKSKRR